MRRSLAPVLLVLFGVSVGLALIEAILRVCGFSAPIWFVPDRELGWSLRPHVRGWATDEGHGWVEINSAGQRDREHQLAKPPGVYRIAVLGDSYAEAKQIDVKDAFWHVLEQKLSECAFQPGKQIEVINFGVDGYGTAHEYLLLKSRAVRYRPDLILLAFTNGNDLRNNSMALEPDKDGPFFRLGADGLVLDDSFLESEAFHRRASVMFKLERALSDYLRLLQLARVARNALAERRSVAGTALAAEPGLDYAVFAPPRNRTWHEAWQVTEALIARISAFATVHGSSVVIVPVTSAVQVDPQSHVREQLQNALGVPDLFYVERRLERIAKVNGARVIPLAYEMQRRAEAEHVYFHGFASIGMGKGHWNENGHRVAAEIIARGLCPKPSRNPG